MFSKLQPVDHVNESEQQRGLPALLYDGMCSQVMGVFTGGAFLVGFAVLLGVSNTVIGLFAAVGPFTQILQIPSIFLVERVRLRKAHILRLDGFCSPFSEVAFRLLRDTPPEFARSLQSVPFADRAMLP